MEPARRSPRASTASAQPGGTISTALRWGVFPVSPHIGKRLVLARRDVTQGKSRRRERRACGVKRSRVRDPMRPQPAFEQLRRNRRRAHLKKGVERLPRRRFGNSGRGLLRTPSVHPRISSRISISVSWRRPAPLQTDYRRAGDRCYSSPGRETTRKAPSDALPSDCRLGRAPGSARLPHPDAAGARKHWLRVEAAGVCHSDVHIRAGYFDLGDGEKLSLEQRGASLPLTLGHETVGEVVAVGPDARDVAIGDKRIVFPWGRGAEGAAGASRVASSCATPRNSSAPGVDGGYADHVIAPHPRYLIDYGEVPTDLAWHLCLFRHHRLWRADEDRRGRAAATASSSSAPAGLASTPCISPRRFTTPR